MKNNIEHIIYQGQSFTVEWYYDENSYSQAFEYYSSLAQSEKIQFLKLVKRMGDVGEILDKTKFRSEGDKIYAFKPKPDRYLCFFCKGKKIVVTNAFRKKQQKLPENEKEKALKIREDYLNRLNKGDYYE